MDIVLDDVMGAVRAVYCVALRRPGRSAMVIWRCVVVVDGAGIVEVRLAALRQALNPKGNVARDPLVTMGQVSFLAQRRKHFISILLVFRPTNATCIVY